MVIKMTSNMICSLNNIPQIINDKEYAKSQNIIVKTVKRDEDTLYILKYDRNKLTFDNSETLGMFRSVITDGKKILCFSPQKSIDYTRFTNSNQVEGTVLEKYMEGTMINLFVNPNTGEWEIATRSLIGARGKFFRETQFTFRYMFLEVLNELNIQFDIFDKKKSYSFVLQHKQNKIVIPHTLNNVYLTNVYEFDGFNVNEVNAYQEALRLNIPYPEILQNFETNWDISTWEDLENKIRHFAEHNTYDFVGVVIKNNSGQRTKIRNPAYDYVKELKGNNPKMQYQYYSLRQHGAVNECLKFYPEYKELFSEFRKNLHSWTKLLHQHYFDCFINKKAPIKDYPHQFKLHMWNLHGSYLNGLKQQGKHISLQEVIKYVNQIHPAKLMYAVNYIFRKKAIDEKKISLNEIIKDVETMTND